MNIIRNNAQAPAPKVGSTAAHPISGGIAPEMLPTIVLPTCLLFDHIEYRTTYARIPAMPRTPAETDAENKKISPKTMKETASARTADGLNLPVTVGLDFLLASMDRYLYQYNYSWQQNLL